MYVCIIMVRVCVDCCRHNVVLNTHGCILVVDGWRPKRDKNNKTRRAPYCAAGGDQVRARERV